MSVDGWNTVLVLGGIRSGKSEFAESLVSDQPVVRVVVTADGADQEPAVRSATTRGWPVGWTIEQTGTDPTRLIEVISGATAGETLLVDDLGGWLTGLLDPTGSPSADSAAVAGLASAILDCPARLVLISPEAGLAPAPATRIGQAYIEALGTTNQAVARVCDAVALVFAGQPVWIKPNVIPPTVAESARTVPTQADPGTGPHIGAPANPVASPEVLIPAAAPPVTPPAPAFDARPTPPPPPPVAPAAAPTEAWTAPTTALPVVATGLVIQAGMELPMPDESAGPEAIGRLASLDLPGAGLGNLEHVVGFAASTQGTVTPTPWRAVRVLLLQGDHSGGAAAGTVPGESARRAGQARACTGPLARLAAEIGASLQVVEAPTAAPIEYGPALPSTAVDAALRFGWRLAEEAADDGVDLIVLAACGAGTEAAAAAVLAATTGAEPAAVLARVVTPGGKIDDAAWMTRCAAVRDAMHRTRRSPRGAKDILAELGGGDITIATGVLLGATARRTPVLLDGPVGVAAGLVSRDLAGQARHWCLLPDHGGHPAVRLAADVLGLIPMFDLRLDLGEGMTAIATLPPLRAALTLAATSPVHPTLTAETGSPDGGEPAANATDDTEFIEPQPVGPGPSTTDDAGRDGSGPSTDGLAGVTEPRAPESATSPKG